MSRIKYKDKLSIKEQLSNFGDALHWQLRKQHMTQTRLAELLGVSSPTVQAYCAGRNMPSIYTLMRICEILQITPNDLLGNKDK